MKILATANGTPSSRTRLIGHGPLSSNGMEINLDIGDGKNGSRTFLVRKLTCDAESGDCYLRKPRRGGLFNLRKRFILARKYIGDKIDTHMSVPGVSQCRLFEEQYEKAFEIQSVPNSGNVLVCSNHGLNLWDVAHNSLIRRLTRKSTYSLVFNISPCGLYLAFGYVREGRTISVLGLYEPRCRVSFQLPPDCKICALGFLANSTELCLITEKTCFISTWSSFNNFRVPLECDGNHHIAVVSDANALRMTSIEGKTRVHDLASGERLHEFPFSANNVQYAKPWGCFLLFFKGNLLVLADCRNGATLRELELPVQGYMGAIESGGDLLAVKCADGIRLLQMRTSLLSSVILAGSCTSMAFACPRLLVAAVRHRGVYVLRLNDLTQLKWWFCRTEITKGLDGIIAKRGNTLYPYS